MQIEQRFFDVQKAEVEMEIQLLKWKHANDLTVAEYLDFLAAQIRATLKYALKHEREEREGQEE